MRELYIYDGGGGGGRPSRPTAHSIYIVQRPHAMFYTASQHAKNMRGVEHACVISASTTCTEPSLNQQQKLAGR